MKGDSSRSLLMKLGEPMQMSHGTVLLERLELGLKFLFCSPIPGGKLKPRSLTARIKERKGDISQWNEAREKYAEAGEVQCER